MPALGPAAAKHLSPVGSGHAFAESVLSFSDNIGRRL